MDNIIKVLRDLQNMINSKTVEELSLPASEKHKILQQLKGARKHFEYLNKSISQGGHMKLTIATEDKRFVVNADEEKINKLFFDMVNEISSWDKGVLHNDSLMAVLSVCETAERVKTSASAKIPEKLEKEVVSKSSAEEVKVTDSTESFKKSFNDFGYKGFLFIKCKHCGKIKGYSAKEKTLEHYCSSCGEYTVLEDLEKIFATCECGQKWIYRTNIDKSEIFDITCVSCNSPIPIAYHEKNKQFETMRF